MRITAILILALLLTSCGGSTVTIISSPEGAQITFDGQNAATPATFSGVKPGIYEISGTRTGYLPNKQKVVVEENKTHQFSLVFEKEVPRTVISHISVPYDGIMVRATDEVKNFTVIPYDPFSDKVGTTFPVDGPGPEVFDLKLMRTAGKLPDANMFVQMTSASGGICWADCQPGANAVTNMGTTKMQSRPNWNYLPLEKGQVVRTPSKSTEGMQKMVLGSLELGSCKSELTFEAQTRNGKTVWSYVDEEGRQDLILSDGKTAKSIWKGEFGLGALDYLINVNSLASIYDGYVFAMLATDEGYHLCVLDEQGKILDKRQVFDFGRDVRIFKYGSFYGIKLTTTNSVVYTFTFDGKKIVDAPDTENADFTKTSGIWIPIGKNFELRINENLSAMLVPGNNGKYRVIYAGSRF
jgi:hypothetical protein